MKSHLFWRPLAAAMLAIIAVPAGCLRAQERGAELLASGSSRTIVDGRSLPSSRQLQTVLVYGAAFAAGESIGLWLTLPSGAVIGLDEDNLRADERGVFQLELGLGPGLPVGVQRYTARGKSSGRGGIALFYLLPGEGPQATAGTDLRLTPSTARQLDTIELLGSGFVANEPVSLWLTLPDGAVVGLGESAAGDNGTFGTTLMLSSMLPVGRHAFTAYGVRSGNTAIAPFELRYGNGLDVPGAELAVSIGTAQQRTVLELSSAGYGAGERMSFWLTMPSGAVLGLGEAQADEYGRLNIAVLLSEALPIGQYFVSFRSNSSGKLGFVKLMLEANGGMRDEG